MAQHEENLISQEAIDRGILTISSKYFTEENIYKAYDEDDASYANTNRNGNGSTANLTFNISKTLSNQAIINQVTFYYKMGGMYDDDVISFSIGSDVTTSLIYSVSHTNNWINGSSTYKTLIYTGEEFSNLLISKGSKDGAVLDFLKKFWLTFQCKTGIYDGGEVYEVKVCIDYTLPEYTVDFGSFDSAQGVASGYGTFEAGETATLFAEGGEGYLFKNWSDGNTENPRYITVNSNLTLTPEFVKASEVKCKIALTDVDEGVEMVGPIGEVIGTGKFEEGVKVKLKAQPANGYEFSHWENNEEDSLRDIEVPESDIECTAYFKPKKFSIEVIQYGEGQINKQDQVKYCHNTQINAIPDEKKGYHFSKWEIEEEDKSRTTDESNPLILNSIKRDLTIYAYFGKNSYSVTCRVIPEDGGIIAGEGQYTHGDPVRLTATPNTGYVFINWEIDGVNYTNSSLEFTVEKNFTVTANFKLIDFEIKTEVSGDGMIEVFGERNYGKEVTLIATPYNRNVFSNWDGYSGSTSPIRKITLNDQWLNDQPTYTANFKKVEETGNTKNIVDLIGKQISIFIDNENKNENCAKRIGRYGLYNCKKLEFVDISQVTEINEYGFSGCNRLSQIKLPNIERIDATAFNNCSNLVALILPNSTKTAELVGEIEKAFSESGLRNGGFVYVPERYLTTYYKNWDKSDLNFRKIEDYPNICN